MGHGRYFPVGFFCSAGDEGLMYPGTERSGGSLMAGQGCEFVSDT